MQERLKSRGSHESLYYIEGGIEARKHTPVYKMHRYFARRPHNVFSHIIESYTEIGDIILDCYCGGGVTLFEGLALGRKVIAIDINPLATFVTECQTTVVPILEYRSIMAEIWDDVRRLTQLFYTTSCRKCQNTAEVRWFELSYKTRCEKCGRETLLSNKNKNPGNRRGGGYYDCQNCGSTFRSIDVDRIGYELVSVVYRCKCTSGRQKAPPNREDIGILEYVESHFERLIEEHGLWYPRNSMPLDWDRQMEDALNRKSIRRFSDLFTKRGLFFTAYLLKCFTRYRNAVSPELHRLLLFTFSATLRYTSNLTYSSPNWMDGRPISWDKHAYWIPNQFVEVNPLEYVEKRRTAISSGLKFQQLKLKEPRKTDSFSDLKNGAGTHIIWTSSSEKMPIPDNSIDAIITDPPYGSNVQYGELSYYWLVWLQKELGLPQEIMNIDDEILVHRRKPPPNQKDYDYYHDALRRVFSEGYRVLKPNKVLVFTFNSRDWEAWYAVIKAALDSGFYLDEKGAVYQHPIEDYKNTSHKRHPGSVRGDFILTFYKLEEDSERKTRYSSKWNEEGIRMKLLATAQRHLSEHIRATTSELYSAIIKEMTPLLIQAASSSSEFSRLIKLLNLKDFKSQLSGTLVWEESERAWCLPDHTKVTKES